MYYCTNTEVGGYIAAWQPSSVPPLAAAFARQVVAAAGPHGRDRAKNLLWAAGKLAGWAVPLGLEPVPEVLLHPSVIERFTAHAPGLSGPARRTLRTNLRFLGRAVVPQLVPADAPLPRERAKSPYTAAEIGGYLALAAAQPTAARRMRAAALVCLGAGAGLIRADLRNVRGTDITARSGGVIVTVGGRRPRTVPVLARYHDRLLASAAFAGGQLVTGGTDPGRHKHREPADPVAGRRGRAAAARHLPATRDVAGRLRAAARPARLPARRRDHLLPAAGRHHRRPRPRQRGAGRDAARRAAHRQQAAVSFSLAVIEDIIDNSGVAPVIESLLPAAVRRRQLTARTLILGMLLALADDRPAQLTRAHAALTALPGADQRRLGVIADWKNGPHQLTYRQVEHTSRLIVTALSKQQPDGAPCDVLAAVCDDLLEASIPAARKNASRSLAADWTDIETWSRPPGTAPQNAPTPRHPGGTATPTSPAPGARCSSATTCPPSPWSPGRTARPCPSWPAG